MLFLPVIFDLDPYSIDYSAFGAPPNAVHLLGTDDMGRDLLARVIFGGRISLQVGILSTLLSILIGLPLGLLAGYYRGIVETLVMRAADVFMCIPAMVLALVIVAITNQSVWVIIFVIGMLGWPAIARLLYANTLAVRNQDYIEAAKTIGSSNLVILTQYVLPNAISPVWMNVAFRISQAIMMEASMSFLGVGIKLPTASWGNIMYSAQSITTLTNKLWIWLPAGCLLMFTVFSFNLIGEGVRDALDPKMKR